MEQNLKRQLVSVMNRLILNHKKVKHSFRSAFLFCLKCGDILAGAQTTLSLQDRLTGPLMKIMRAMDSTIRVMEQMDSTTQRLDQRSLANARRNITNASADLERLRSSMDSAGKGAEGAARQQEKFNNSLGDGLSEIRSYAAGLLVAVGAYKLFNAAKNTLSDMFSRGIDFHAFKQSSEVAFTTFLCDAKKAKQYMDDMYAFALKTPFSYPDLLESSRNLIAFGIEAKNTFPIMQAIGDAVAAIGGGNAEMQNMANIFGQIQAQGKITAVEVDRLSQYGINAFEILGKAAGKSANEMRDQVSDGAVDAGMAITALVEGMNKKFGGLMEGVKGTWRGAIDSLNSARRNAGAAMMDDFMEPLTKTIGIVTDAFKKVPKYIGPAVAAFVPLVNMFNETFGGNRFDGIFKGIGVTLAFIANLLSWIGQGALWVAGIFADYWSYIAPIAIVLGVVLTVITSIWFALAAVRIVTIAWAAAQRLVNLAFLSNPITWILIAILSIIALVIYAMVAWADTTATVIGAIVGSVYWLGAVFYNTLMGIGNFSIMVAEWFVNHWNQAVFGVQLAWIGLNLLVRMVFDAIGNAALRTAEFFINIWNNGVYLVQMGFYKMQEGILTVMSSVASGIVGAVNHALSGISTLVNKAVSGINSLISLINKIPGVDIGEIGNVDLKASTAAVDKLNSIKANLVAPTKAGPVNLGSFNTAGDYMKSVNMPTAPEQVSFGRLEYKNLGDAFVKGQQVGSNLSLKASEKLTGTIDKVTGLMSGKNSSLMNPGEVPAGGYDPTLGGATAPGAAGKKSKNPTGGKLDKIGKIEDKINIADEDLKLLLEMADSRSINQVNITLSPSVTFKDVTMKEEADIDKVISKINKSFEDDMARSVEGVVT
ncbi:tape measure protein [Heyndrickxia oleronia]|uniref:tape measure protein n=1 Tax=Heyndrickxia oleronia TaxID=38875 RepID=UPI00333BE83E